MLISPCVDGDHTGKINIQAQNVGQKKPQRNSFFRSPLMILPTPVQVPATISPADLIGLHSSSPQVGDHLPSPKARRGRDLVWPAKIETGKGTGVLGSHHLQDIILRTVLSPLCQLHIFERYIFIFFLNSTLLLHICRLETRHYAARNETKRKLA